MIFFSYNFGQSLLILIISQIVVNKCEILNNSNPPFYYDYIRESLTDTYSNNNNNNQESQEEENFNLKINKIRLNTYFKVDCDLNVSNDFLFERLIFNKSLYNIEDYYLTKLDPNQQQQQQQQQQQYSSTPSNPYSNEITYFKLKSQNTYKNLFNKYDKHWTTNRYSVKYSKYSDSGRYYCIYSKKTKNPNNIEYLVTSYLYLIYDDTTLVKNFKETVELDACVDNLIQNQDDLNYIQWYYNVDSDYTSSYMSLESKTSALVIRLDDLRLFDIVYQCHNSLNGAFKFYKLECSNCDAFLSAPLISPTRQTVYQGSDTQFTCEKPPNTNEPDRYQWFKQNTEFNPENNNNYNLSQSIGYGSILDLKNLTKDQAGWYICCVVNSPVSPEARREKLVSNNPNQDDDSNDDSDDLDSPNFFCSSVELKILPRNVPPKNNLFIYILASTSILIISVMGILIYFCGRKIKTFKNTHKAAFNLKNNEIYQDKKQLDMTPSSSSSCLEQLIDDQEELKNLKEILKSSSSIEALLDEDDINRWRIPIENFKFGQIIGRGAFGIVIHGTLKQEMPTLKRDADSGLESCSYVDHHENMERKKKYRSVNVAIKKLPDNATQKNYYDLFKELQLMLNVGEHPHIVNLKGYCIENTSLYIVTDYAKYGSLKDFLRKNSGMDDNQITSFKITNDHLLLYSYQIAQGMEYLHSKKILHRDLAARNILVDDIDSIKIADFGLARNIHTNYYYVQKQNGKVPLKWMSPESLRYQKVSKESDVWSYGVLLWEIYSYGCTPYPLLQPEDILEKLESGYRMEKPRDCDEFIYENLMKKCWDLEPKKRLKFSELVQTFDNLLNKPDYISIKELIIKRKNLNEIQNYQNDEDLVVLIPQTKITNASESDCSTISETRFGLNVPNCLTSSASSFNTSTTLSTNTTTTTTSQRNSIDDDEKDIESSKKCNETLNTQTYIISKHDQTLPIIDDEPLLLDSKSLNKKFKQVYRADKKLRENPIYHKQQTMETNNNENSSLNDKTFFKNDNTKYSEKLKNTNLKNIFNLFRSNSVQKKDAVLTSDV